MIEIKPQNDVIKLIGRTKNNNAIFNVQKSSVNENIVEQIANNFILSNNIRRLPIDVVDIAKNNNWFLIPFSKAPSFIYNKFSELLYTDWGFTLQQDRQYYIFYNDNIKLEIQRFTIAHEIGHIVLKHFKDEDFCVKEKDANIFASCLLMPKSIIKECNVNTIYGVSALCGVSYSAASYKFTKISPLMEQKNSEIEMRIVKQFDTYIANYYK